ncbi:serine/threonine-protein kinase [Ilumatobacter nonamiensis]|uniref:serine/threonine-protein kinase n=1 Tax=Ilumatobacter nonamiensis TaxID=467093 RepID=UPI000344E798|nr:serine/threonine-protein kinase [Ilumatobacter nonamiensis]
MTEHGSPGTPVVRLEGYEIIDEIGAGGFSVVYRARQLALNREVAIKVLTSGFSSDSERRTFERECHALGRLSHHPNIVTVFNDAMTHDGRPAIVMELYGANYRDRLSAQGPLAPDEVVGIGIRLAGALQTAHDHDVLHRDLKPHNIFVSAYGEPALGDFGISTIDDERSQSRGSGLSIAYAAPEGLEGDDPSVAGDVYSLAVTMYQLISGRTPFSSGELATTIRRILTESPPRLATPNLPTGLNKVVQGALAKAPRDRPRSMQEFAEQLREVQRRNGTTPTPIPRLHDDGSRAAGTSMRTSIAQARPGSAATSTDPSTIDVDPTDTDGASPSIPRVVRRPDPLAPQIAPSSPVDEPRRPEDTIARARPASTPAQDVDDESDDAGPSRGRRWFAAAGVGLLIAVIVFGINVLGGDDDETTVTTQAAGTVEQDPFFGALAAPEQVRIVAVDGGFRVTYRMPEDAEAVEIEVVSGIDDGATTTADGDPIEIETAATSLCVVARSIGAGGRLSTDAGPICG